MWNKYPWPLQVARFACLSIIVFFCGYLGAVFFSATNPCDTRRSHQELRYCRCVLQMMMWMSLTRLKCRDPLNSEMVDLTLRSCLEFVLSHFYQRDRDVDSMNTHGAYNPLDDT